MCFRIFFHHKIQMQSSICGVATFVKQAVFFWYGVFFTPKYAEKKGVSHATTSTKKPGGLRFEAVSFSSIHDMSGTQLFVAFWRFFSTIHFRSQLFPQNAGDFHHVKREWQFCSIPNWLLKSKGWLFWRGPVNLWKLMLFSKKLHDMIAAA